LADGCADVDRKTPRLFFLDVEVNEAGIFLLTKKFVAGAGAPPGQIVPGAGIGTKDLKNLAGIDFVDFLLGAQQRHGAAQTFGVQGPVGDDTLGSGFEITHLLILLKTC
jgi:hypothetical protein